MSEEKMQKLPRQKFSLDEDKRLRQLVVTHGEDNWPAVAAQMRNRHPRQCKERWTKYLCPKITDMPWTSRDDQFLEEKVGELGPRWKEITKSFPGRTDVFLKNRHNVLKRRLNMCIKRIFKLPLRQRKTKQTADSESNDIFQDLDWLCGSEIFECNPADDEILYLWQSDDFHIRQGQ
jgi:hypothetical protein